jgi:hypothetical protein
MSRDNNENGRLVAKPVAFGSSVAQTVLILCCYFIPPFGFLLPFPNPTGRLLATAALLALAAILAFVFVPAGNGHRSRLMLFGGVGSATLLYYTAKPVLGLP